MPRTSVQWFRAYSEMVDDEKLRLLSFEDRWHFVALLCCKASGIIDDAGPLLRRKVAVKLGLDPAALEEVARRLAEVELIDRETLQPIAWDRRQFVSDSSADRTRAYRERAKRHSDVTVTPPEAESDTDTDTEEQIERAREPAKPAQPAAKRSPNGSRIPDDFPTNVEVVWCQQERPDLDAPLLVAKFRDYWLSVAGARARKANWPATWRNFVRSERRALPQARASPYHAHREQRDAVLAELTGRNRPQEVIDVHATDATPHRPAIASGMG